MAAEYDITGMRTTTEVIGSRVEDVEAVTAVTKPSGVVFEIRVPLGLVDISSPAATAASVAQYLVPTADDIEVDMAHPGVEAMEWFQDVNAANQLVDRVNVVVSSTSGRSTIVLEEPFGWVDPRVLLPLVDKARATLDAIEAY